MYSVYNLYIYGIVLFFPNLNSPISIIMFLSCVVVFFFLCVSHSNMFFLRSLYAHLYMYKYAFN